jgi:hypothetical protein
VAGTTWAISHFVLDTRKIENAQMEVNNYRAKIEVLEQQSSVLREANQEYLAILRSNPATLEYYKAKIKALEDSKASLLKRVGQSEQPAPSHAGPYFRSAIIGKGEAFRDPKTGVVLGVTDVNAQYRMGGNLTLPGKTPQRIQDIEAGKAWTFHAVGGEFTLLIRSVNWIGDTVAVEVFEDRTERGLQE